jgi:fucose 4-O-acetylase-like acetyltransferase
LATLAGVLITLVVAGHAIEEIEGSAAELAYQWVYLFHMPAFIFVSGYVTQLASHWSAREMVSRLAMPYFVFEVIHGFLAWWLVDDQFEFTPWSPSWGLWYLVALAAWRLMAPSLIRIRGIVAISVVGALMVGMVDGFSHTLSGGRIFAFLPFFVVGLLWKRSWWHTLASGWRPWAGAAVLVASAFALVAMPMPLERRWWYFSSSYARMDQSILEGMAIRAAILLVAAILVAAVISVAYRHIPLMASIGAATLTVYLGHTVALYYIHVEGWPADWAGTVPVLVTLTAGAVLAWVLSRQWVVRATRPLMSPAWWSKSTRASQVSNTS